MDLSMFSDEELFKLIHLAAQEIAKRGHDVQGVLAQMASDKKQQEEEEKAKKIRVEKKKAALAEAIYGIIGKHCKITLWNRDGKDKRVYIDEGDGAVRKGWKICIYVEGNSRQRPGDVEGAEGLEAEALKEIAKVIVKRWQQISVLTRVYVARDDLERGGDEWALYAPIVEMYRQKVAEEEAAKAAAIRAEWPEVIALAERLGSSAVEVSKYGIYLRKADGSNIAYFDFATLQANAKDESAKAALAEIFKDKKPKPQNYGKLVLK